MVKRSVVQRDFSLGELREEFLERDDLPLRQQSLRRARNISLLPTGGFETRPGTSFFRSATVFVDGFAEIVRLSGESFMAAWQGTYLYVYDDEGVEVASFSAPWTYDVYWTLPYGDTLLIGSDAGIYTLRHVDGAWSLTLFQFDAPMAGRVRRPYWVFHSGVTITPSAETGTITVTASSGIFSAGRVNTTIRYGYRAINLTGYVSPTVMNGTVVTRLPPTYEITLDALADGLWLVGDVVNAATTQFSGQIVDRDVGTKKIWVLSLTEGIEPTTGEDISCSEATAEITGVTTSTPKASTLWDEALINHFRGYPQTAAIVSGRLVLAGFKDAPNVIAISSARLINDFEVGTDDDDGIVRAIGGIRIAHVITAGDLLIMSDQGTYVASVRDAPMTPGSFNPVLVDSRPVSPLVKPAVVRDMALFVEGSTGRLAVAIQSGNIYLKWGVRVVSDLHAHLFTGITHICPPARTDRMPRVLVLRSDGTITAGTWSDDLETIGFVQWDTPNGFYKFAAPCFGRQYLIVRRHFGPPAPGGQDLFFLECFRDTMLLDSTVRSFFPRANGTIPHLAGQAVTVYQNRFFLHGQPVDVNGAVQIEAGAEDFPVSSGGEQPQIGLPFPSEASVWPVEMLDAPHVGLKRVRATRFGVSVQDAIRFEMRCNRHSRTVGGYSFGDDLSEPAPLSERIFTAPVTGRPPHHDLGVVRSDPGPWRVLAMTQEVTD